MDVKNVANHLQGLFEAGCIEFAGYKMEWPDPLKSGSPDVSVGHVTVTLPGNGGHSPPSFSIAKEISA